MAIKTKKGYECSYCQKVYDTPALADACRDGHDLIYLSVAKDDLRRLWQFLISKDEDLLTETLVRQLSKYTNTLTQTKKEE